MILTIVVFILVLGLLVIIHEFGHFVAAKKSGVKVEEFAVGFPPRLYSVKKGETEYSINAIPLGGYVKMLGELEHSKDKRAFENQTPWKRFVISIAGVLMNLILAWFILTLGFAFGMSPIVSPTDQIPGKIVKSEVVIAGIEKDKPAEEADIRQGDVMISGKASDGDVKFVTIDDFTSFTLNHKGQAVKFIVNRDNETIEKDVTLSTDENARLGVSIVDRSIVKVPWYKAPYVALRETVEIVKITFEFFGSLISRIFSTGQVGEEVGGPVAIYVYTGLAVKAGFMVLMQFIAMLSINLAVINILPFPALDGGRLIFIITEIVARKRLVKEKVENIIHTVGYILLILLFIAITYKDIARLIIK